MGADPASSDPAPSSTQFMGAMDGLPGGDRGAMGIREGVGWVGRPGERGGSPPQRRHNNMRKDMALADRTGGCLCTALGATCTHCTVLVTTCTTLYCVGDNMYYTAL